MADNYLENQYEQYQARKAAWEKAKNPARYKRYISRHFPQKGGKKVFVTGGAGVLAKPL